MNFEVVYYVSVPDYNVYMDIQQEINLSLFKAFQEEGIAFAYPTREIIMRPNGQTNALATHAHPGGSRFRIACRLAVAPPDIPTGRFKAESICSPHFPWTFTDRPRGTCHRVRQRSFMHAWDIACQARHLV